MQTIRTPQKCLPKTPFAAMDMVATEIKDRKLELAKEKTEIGILNGRRKLRNLNFVSKIRLLEARRLLII